MNILFMCVANSARSQLAEGLAKEILGPGVMVQSAGSTPTKLNPMAIKAMDEVGIDISRHWSKSVDDLSPGFLVKLDYVITLCAEEACAALATKAKRLQWPINDPATKESNEAELNQFREARDLIKQKLVSFRAEMGF